MRIGLLALLALTLATAANAATIEVGAGRRFTTLAAAAAAAQDGDTVDIFPGSYASGAAWTANNLLIEAAPGSKHGAVAVKGPVNGKGIFDVIGDDVRIDNIRFNYASVADGNGAGIRAEGHNLTVANSQFYHDEDGMLITPLPGKEGGAVTVTACTFDLNGTNRSGYAGYAHAIYANHLGLLTVTGSKFTRAVEGHFVKSRALNTVVTGNTLDDTKGTDSYLIDVPQGGPADIENNVLIKGANAANHSVAIAYGEEMAGGPALQNPPGPVTISNNHFTNRNANTVIFVNNASTPPNPVMLTGNALTPAAGPITPLSGPGTIN